MLRKELSTRFDVTQRKLDGTALSEEKERWQDQSFLGTVCCRLGR